MSRRSNWSTMAARAIVVAVAMCCAGIVVTAPAKALQLIMLEEDGCPWCERWNEEVGVAYHKTAEGKRAPLRRLDIHAPLPANLKFLIKGSYTPTFILVDKGREIGRIRGYPGEDFFWGFLGQMLERVPLVDKRNQSLN